MPKFVLEALGIIFIIVLGMILSFDTDDNMIAITSLGLFALALKTSSKHATYL